MWDEDPKFQAAAYKALKVTFGFGAILFLIVNVAFGVPFFDAVAALLVPAGGLLLYGLILWSVGKLLQLLFRTWKKHSTKG